MGAGERSERAYWGKEWERPISIFSNQYYVDDIVAVAFMWVKWQKTQTKCTHRKKKKEITIQKNSWKKREFLSFLLHLLSFCFFIVRQNRKKCNLLEDWDLEDEKAFKVF